VEIVKITGNRRFVIEGPVYRLGKFRVFFCEAVKLGLCAADSFFRSLYFAPDSRIGQLVS